MSSDKSLVLYSMINDLSLEQCAFSSAQDPIYLTWLSLIGKYQASNRQAYSYLT